MPATAASAIPPLAVPGSSSGTEEIVVTVPAETAPHQSIGKIATAKVRRTACDSFMRLTSGSTSAITLEQQDTGDRRQRDTAARHARIKLGNRRPGKGRAAPEQRQDCD